MSEDTIRGKITTFERVGGSVLTADVATGGFVLPVNDTSDFGVNGMVSIVGLSYTVTDVDDDADTITIDPPLPAGVTADEKVDVLDPETGRLIYGYEVRVLPDDADPTDRPITADASDNLARSLEEGTRGMVGESVSLVRTGRYSWTAYLVNEGTGTVYADNAYVAVALYTGQVNTTDGSTTANVGATAVGGNPGVEIVQSGKTGWVKMNPANGAIELTADTANGATVVWIGSGGLDPADFLVFGKSKLLDTVWATGELHGSTVHVDSVPTSSNAANVYMGPAGKLFLSTSSLRYKKAVRDAAIDVDAFMALRRISYLSRNPEDGTGRFYGFPAEDVAAAGFEELVTRNEDGEPTTVAYPVMVVHLHAALEATREELAAERKRIDALTKRLDALEAVPSNKPRPTKEKP